MDVPPPPTNVRAGWYPDPSGRFEHRYHNGRDWTGDVSSQGSRFVDPLRAPAPPHATPWSGGASPGSSPSAPLGARASHRVSVAAMVCGILAVTLAWMPLLFVAGIVLALLGLVFGLIGLSRSRVTGAGKGFAITGIVTGGAALALAAVGVYLTVVVFRAVDRYQNPPPGTARIEACVVTDGQLVVEGTMANLGDSSSGYTVLIRGVASTGRPVVSVRATVDDVAPGATSPFRAVTAHRGDDLECRIDEVTGPLPFGIAPG